MARTESLHDHILDDIAVQIGRHLHFAAEHDLLSAESTELGETFALWMLRAEAVASSKHSAGDLSRFARPMDRWHHQVKHDGKAASFARSTRRDDAGHSVRELFVSPLAESIDQAIDWIDRNIQDDPMVLLLTAPAYHLHAFWLVGEAAKDSRLLIIDAPVRFTHLKPLELQYSRQFLDALLLEQPIIGIHPQLGQIHRCGS